MPTDPRLAEDLDGVVARTGDVWQALRGQRLFITGGTGFFGCWLLESLVHARERLGLDVSATVLTRSAEAFGRKASHLASHPALTLIEGDVRHFAFPSGHFSHVIHAATDSATLAHPAELFDTIVLGTRRVLDFARQSGARRLLFTSSGAVYGTQPPDVVRLSEEYSPGPDAAAAADSYARGKRAAERLCASAASSSGVEAVIARGFAFVGPYLPLDAHFAIGNFIRDRLRGDAIRVAGDGTARRSYLYAADLAVWLWALLIRGASGRAYNVGSPHAVTIAELAALVADAGETTLPVLVAGSPAAGLRRHYVPDVSRAVMELGVRQEVGLGDAIQRTLDWHRDRRAPSVGGEDIER